MFKKKFLLYIFAVLFFGACTAPSRTVPVKPVPAPEPAKPVTPPPVVSQPQPVEEKHVNALTAKEKAEGWALLFDGVSSDGWHAYGSRSIGPSWKIANGTIYLDADAKNEYKTATGGDIVTDEEFGNFELQLEWRISKGGNSGIIIYLKEDKKYPKMWATGPEMQILDNDNHPDGKITKHRAGDLYDMMASRTEPVKPVGQWNQVLIRSVNGKLDFYLNNINVISTTMWSDSWRNMIANSKFASMPDFGTFKTGRIGLQDHGNNVWFRNIKIRRL